MQLSPRGDGEQACWELERISEVWEAEERETGYTTILVFGSDGKAIGTETRSEKELEMRDKVFPLLLLRSGNY